jgi:hypothetical protein
MIATTPSNTSPLLKRKSMMYTTTSLQPGAAPQQRRGEEGKGDTADKLCTAFQVLDPSLLTD